jgi:cytochrome c2
MRLSIFLLSLLLVACGLRTKGIPGAGDSAAGKEDIYRVGCGSCHTIPGIIGAHGKVGPSLEGIASHGYVAGELPNQPANLQHWIQHPHSVHRDSLMPELGLTDAQSRDITAYLYSLNNTY